MIYLDAKSLEEHSWREVEKDIFWCPLCNTVECLRKDNVIRHPGSIVTNSNLRPTSRTGRKLRFRKRGDFTR